jgi:hypothetical protein
MAKKKKLLLVQPHSDDILFSASSFLFNLDKYSKVALMTVEKGDEKRVAEDHALVDLFGIDEYFNSDMDFKDLSYYHYYKELKFKKFSADKSMECLEDYFKTKFLLQLKADVRNKVLQYVNKGYIVVNCLGVGHPMHYFIREALLDLTNYFYRDWPHSYKMKARNEVEPLTSDMKKVDLFDFDEDLHEVKFQTAYQIYKTQRSLLFFEKGYIDKKIKEEFYKLK